MPPTPQPRAPWNPWPTAIITFFAVAILGFAAFVAFCSLHPTDLVAPDYYEQEVRYQAQIDRVQRVQSLHEAASVVYDAPRERVVITLPPAHAGTNTTGQIRLYRPSTAGLDQKFKLEPDAAAFYAALLLGYQQLISSDWKEDLNRVGITHLLSISGMHLGLVSMFTFWIFRRLIRGLCPSVLRRVSDKQIVKPLQG